jgi:hypothetical protein
VVSFTVAAAVNPSNGQLVATDIARNLIQLFSTTFQQADNRRRVRRAFPSGILPHWTNQTKEILFLW